MNGMCSNMKRQRQSHHDAEILLDVACLVDWLEFYFLDDAIELKTNAARSAPGLRLACRHALVWSTS